MFAALLLIMYGCGVADHISSDSRSLESNQFYSVIGKISKVIEKENSTEIYLERARVQKESGNIMVTGILCSAEDIGYMKGDIISFNARLNEPKSPENPGEFNARHYYAAQNIFYLAKPDQINMVKKCGNPWLKGIFWLKKRLRRSYMEIASLQDAGVCISIVLGDKSLLSDELKNQFQNNGIAHILAISGLHISIIGLNLYQFIRKRGVNFSISAAISVLIMLSYGIMTGNSVSTIRAVVMFGVTVYAQVFGRTYDSISAICLSASVIILRYPYCIYNAGFYLSFGAVIGIVVLNPAIIRCFEIRNLLLKGFVASLSVTMTTLPIVAASYYEIPVYALFLNIVVVPCMSLLMVSALLAGFVGIVCVPAGIFLMGPASFIIQFYQVICGLAESLPKATEIIGAPEIWRIVAYEILLLGGAVLAMHRKKKGAHMVMAGIAAALCILLVRFPNGMEIVMLSVGQGDCMYISSGKYSILIDGGSSSKKNVGKYTIIPFLKYKGVRSLDYVVLTHPDSDHYSGLLELLEDGRITVKCFVMPYITAPDEAYRNVYERAAAHAKSMGTMSAGEMLIDDGLQVKCLHPSQDYVYASANDYSLVFQITYGQFDMITTGDLESSGEMSIQNHFDLKQVEVLKCGHHGSSTSSGEPWLAALQPDIALISCGRDNRYGHPHEETLERLEKSGTKVFRTDESGAIEIKVRNGKVLISSYNKDVG